MDPLSLAEVNEMFRNLDLWFEKKDEQYRDAIILIFVDAGATSDILIMLNYLLENQPYKDILQLFTKIEDNESIKPENRIEEDETDF